jgi:hypothetical protein
VRDESALRKFPGPPAAVFFYSRNRNGEHSARHLAAYTGILQAVAYAGFGELYQARRRPAPITEAAYWSHGRRNFFVLAHAAKAPLALEAVRRIDEIFAIEREINGLSARAAGSNKPLRESGQQKPREDNEPVAAVPQVGDLTDARHSAKEYQNVSRRKDLFRGMTITILEDGNGRLAIQESVNSGPSQAILMPFWAAM